MLYWPRMALMADLLAQLPYRCRFDWGHDGARRAAARGDILVVVDILRFSTAAVTAVAQGAVIYPCAPGDDLEAIAQRVGAHVACASPARGTAPRYSLSPGSYDGVQPGTRIVLPSPNGATCSRYGRVAPYLFVGALVNARAVGEVLSALLAQPAGAVTVLACGERAAEVGEDGALRVAIEDYLGAGAILSCLTLPKSPEARVCEHAFLGARDHLGDLLRDSISGRELRAKGWSADVERAARLNLYPTVPVMREERLEPFRP